MSSKKTIKSAFESMMFTWGEPLEAKVAAEVFNISRQEAVEYFEELKEEYEQEGRGIVIRRITVSYTHLDVYKRQGVSPPKKRTEYAFKFILFLT